MTSHNSRVNRDPLPTLRETSAPLRDPRRSPEVLRRFEHGIEIARAMNDPDDFDAATFCPRSIEDEVFGKLRYPE
jgi:hypothetical protein